ncbi:gamma-glutamyl-gamma-aminobutyrate hydrolase family protein [Effusibacillus pohliae]|uniref:gamma-glutamyl-gamma-aminobutyrate hydrolase family protein n=1 Tax=Effusibacillus pohliae TaxID=232270 RepID=UPI0003700119|nr:gamma-glutamyl-gamma-aminobutyrate hydrolase family protein [Effusibacillus pohliae]
MQPVIGITSTLVKINEFSEGVYVHQDYHRAIVAAGGLPLVLPLTDPDSFSRLIDLCDGVIFSGGEDVDPQQYGAEPQQHLGPIHPQRDRVEVAAVRYTIGAGKPLLAICRGAQVLNVALGGTLYQDLPSEYPGALQHSQKAARGVDTHWVELAEGSYLHRIFGQTQIRVNSLHHQAIRQAAAGLVVTGTASDGVIEAVEAPGCVFTIGVQWHPESMAERDPLMQALFREFVDQSRAAKKNRLSAPLTG